VKRIRSSSRTDTGVHALGMVADVEIPQGEFNMPLRKLPLAINAACTEIWSASNIAFGLCPLLTLSAIEALDAHGSEELKHIYLAKLISGEWTGTMQLTEPQAGSDVGALRTRAERAPDGTYRIKGTKIFITYGDHDMTDNIVHFVLARLPDAPAGTKGISLFLMPKFLVNADGSLGERNDIYPSGVEHKFALPACSRIRARLAVGLEGVGADRAYQRAGLRASRPRRRQEGDGLDPIIASRRQADAAAEGDDRAARSICCHRGCPRYFRAREIAQGARRRCCPQRCDADGRSSPPTSATKWLISVQVHGGIGSSRKRAPRSYRDARIPRSTKAPTASSVDRLTRASSRRTAGPGGSCLTSSASLRSRLQRSAFGAPGCCATALFASTHQQMALERHLAPTTR
jgi:hypothetical protein